MNPGSSSTGGGIQDNGGAAGGRSENRQAFLTFGDASWGSIKLGKDLGIYASDAILNDMTLLGVGSGAGSLAGNTTTLGRIGTGFMYADWKSQVAYSSPNFNGLQFTAGVTQAWNASNNLSNLLSGGTAITSENTALRGGNQPAFEGKASYDFAADAVKAKLWVSGLSQQMKAIADDGTDRTATAWDIGANVNAAGFGLTGYYGEGKGIGQTIQFADGFDADGNKRKSEQYYVQATYTLPGVGTKLGASYGESKLNANAVDTTWNSLKDQMWVAGVYHPITKHLNLVAEYSETERKVSDGSSTGASTAESAKGKTVSLGAILFF